MEKRETGGRKKSSKTQTEESETERDEGKDLKKEKYQSCP